MHTMELQGTGNNVPVEEQMISRQIIAKFFPIEWHRLNKGLYVYMMVKTGALEICLLSLRLPKIGQAGVT